jgi:hypothetical protein
MQVLTERYISQCCGTVAIFYGSVSDFWQVTVPIPVPAPYLDHKKHSLKNSFLHSKLFYKGKIYKFYQIIKIFCKMLIKKF